MNDVNALQSLVLLGREERFLEYKHSRPWNDLRGKIAKTAMGMSNIRDGGTIIVGVTGSIGAYVAEGMSRDEIDTYKDDDVQAFVNSYAMPYARLNVKRVSIEGKLFIAITVMEFDEVPVLCKRSWGSELEQAACYTRSHRIPETCKVQSETELREIFEMATEKGIRKFLRQTSRAGMTHLQGVASRDRELFNQELEGL